MNFEELKPVLEQKPELLGEIVSSFKDSVTQKLAETGFIIRSKEEDASYLDSQIKNLLPAKVGAEFGNAMRAIDEQIKTITGIEKSNGEKTTDYAKRAVEEIKTAGADPQVKQRIKDLENLLSNATKEKQSEIEKLQQQLFSKDVEFQQSAFLDSANFAVPSHLKTDEEKQQYIALQRQSLKTMFSQTFAAKKDEAGKIVFYEGDKPLLNTKDGSPLTASDLYKERFGAFIAPAQQVRSGTGQGQTGTVGGQGTGTFGSKEEIHAHLKEAGVAVGSKAYLDQFKALAESSKVAL
jgi:hypothetical protein